MADPALFPCLGLQAFPWCSYNPASPNSLYFSLGEATGALAVTLAIHQLLRPIYRFRLSARYASPRSLYICLFAGFAATVVAAITPSLRVLHANPLGYAINWEIVAALLFAIPYGAVALAVALPIKVSNSRLPDFARGVATLLSGAHESDHLDLVPDLRRSLPRLLKAASFADHLRDTSAFFHFIYRKELESASYARNLLLIIADPLFCESMVKRAPWRVADMLREISDRRLHAESAKKFIGELARQAILRDDGMMEREVGYHGFGSAPLLSESLFSDYFILRHHNPFDSFYMWDADVMTAAVVKRFNSAAERAFETIIEEKDIWESDAGYDIQQVYEALFMRADSIRNDPSASYHLPLQIHYSARMAIKSANNLLASLNPTDYNSLFVVDAKVYRRDLLESLVDIVFDALKGISNNFNGVDDPFWMTGHGIVSDIFPLFGTYPDGMTPFQQRLAIKIIDKLRDNMNGFYPSISRVLLACVGPYAHVGVGKNQTAFNILKDAVYQELKNVGDIDKKTAPGKLSDYLPDNVHYDPTQNKLIHHYRSGTAAETNLSEIDIEPIDLLDSQFRRALDQDEIKVARQHR